MSNPNSPEARRLAKELSDLRKLQKASHIAPRLPYSSVPEGNLVVTDSEGNVVDVVGSKPKDGQIILPGLPPSKPSAPVVVATLGTVQSSWDGLFVEEYVPPDMAHLEVHGSTEGEEFEPTSATLLGTITNLSGGTLTAGLEYGTWFFRLVAVTTSGSKSVPSDASSCEVIPLVEAPDMVEVLADIDARYDGVITEAGQLGSRLDQAALDLAAHEQRLADAEANLINLNDVELVQLQASVDQAKLDLAQAQTDVANALAGLQLTEADLANLKNVALPALQDTVTAAENRLATAEGEIVTSKNRLAEAESDLTDAFGQISAVDSKATTAITNASTAQSTADTAKTDAATAAGIAGGKADVLIQSTAPATAMRKATTLWIDTTSGANTPKRWNGSAWVTVTDKAATDAATAAANADAKAQQALTAAGSAQSTADGALTMAGSKSKVFYSTSAPSGTGTAVNDLWRRQDASKNIIGEWYWTGTVWQATQITTDVISNLDVGKLTAGSAIIQTAVINKIAAQTATVIELNADRITAGTLAAERLNVTDLAARIATVIQLNADRITSGTIATGRLNATEVAAAVANVIQLNASRITAGTINTARLNTAEIAAAVATIIQLNADRITAGVINTDRLNVNEIAARSASFQTVDVKNLFVTTGTMQEAVINKLWTDVVLSKKITAEMIAVGDFQNYATINPSMNLNVSIPSKWSTVTDGNYTRTAPTSENYLMFKNMDGPVPFQAGDKLRISFDAVADSADATYSGRIWLYNSSGSYLTGFDASFSDSTITSTEKRFTGNLEIPSIPATASQYLIGISGTNIKTVKVRNVRAIRMTAGELIVDGAITASKIAANAIEADKIASNAITADKIAAGAITAEKISAKSISTDKLAIGSFDNILPDPDNLLNSWIDPSASSPAVARWQYTSTDARPERAKNYQQINLGSGGNAQGTVYFGYNREMIPVEPGQSFTGYAWMRNNKTINTEYNYVSLRFYFYDKAGALISGSGGNQNGGSNSALSGVWTRVGGIPVTAPAGAVGMRIRPTVYFSNHVANGEIFFCGAMSVFRAVSGELIVDGSIDGKTITGANIIGSRYQFNGAGAGLGYNTIIDNDELGAYMAWEIPGQILPATIRAFDNDPWSDYITPTLVLRPPSKTGFTARDAVKISSGYDGGTGGLVDIVGNLWVRGELRGRYQVSNSQGYYTSLAINDVTNGYTADSPTIKSLGMYNRTYTSSSNLYITSNGYMGRATSVRAAKLAIEDIPQEQIDALLNVKPRWWFDKSDSEKLADYTNAINNPASGLDPDEISDVPNNLTRIPGLVAEEVEEAGATAFVTYDRDGEGNLTLSGVNYDRVGPALLGVAKTQRDKIAEQDEKIATLESRLALIESQLGININQ